MRGFRLQPVHPPTDVVATPPVRSEATLGRRLERFVRLHSPALTVDDSATSAAVALQELAQTCDAELAWIVVSRHGSTELLQEWNGDPAAPLLLHTPGEVALAPWWTQADRPTTSLETHALPERAAALREALESRGLAACRIVGLPHPGGGEAYLGLASHTPQPGWHDPENSVLLEIAGGLLLPQPSSSALTCADLCAGNGRVLELLANAAPSASVFAAIAGLPHDSDPRLSCAAYWLDPRSNRLSLVANAHVPADVAQAMTECDLVRDRGPVGQAFTSRKPTTLAPKQPLLDSPYLRAMANTNLDGCWHYPICDNDDRVVAWLAVWLDERRSPREPEAQAMRMATQLARLASEQRRTRQRLKQDEAAVRALHEVTSAPHLGFDEQANRLLEMGCSRFGLEVGILSRIDGNHFTVVHVHAPSGMDLRPGSSFHLPSVFCAETIKAAGPVGFASVSGTSWQQHPAFTEFGFEAYLGTRVVVDNRVWGTLGFYNRPSRTRPIDPAECDLIQLMAKWIGSELDRQRNTEALHLTQTSLERILDGAFRVDPRGRLVFVNQTACDMTGYTRRELTGMSVPDLVESMGHADWYELFAQIKSAGRIVLDTRMRLKNSDLMPTEVTANYVAFRGREYIFAFVRDVSDRRRAERSLRESEERLSKAFRAVPSGILIMRLGDGAILDVNDSLSHMVGYRRDEMMGQTFGALGLGEDPDERENIYDVLIRQGGVARDRMCTWISQNGDARNVMVSAERLEIGGDSCSLISAEDVTERLKSEAETERLATLLRQSQKMEALGQLAGGVAHDFNNILTAILGNAELLMADSELSDGAVTSLEQIQRAGEQAAALTRQLLAFSRKQARELEVLDLNEIVAGMESMIRRLIGEHVQLETVLASSLDSILADAGQMEQVILNLALNARDAMLSGGRMSIQTKNAMVDEETASQRVNATSGAFVRISVSDTGHGISDDAMHHIFEPFFTTKPMEQGTGLGLATVYGIVNQSGGHITVDSTPEKGTTFSIFLPVIDAKALPKQRDPVTDTAARDETILVAEDEWMVRDLACKILETAGYRVLSAGHGRIALDVAAEHDGPIDLLLTDTVMPEISGAELAHQLAETRPDMRVLYVSGYTSDILARHGVDESRVELLEKPFNAATLLKRVRRVLDKPRDGKDRARL